MRRLLLASTAFQFPVRVRMHSNPDTCFTASTTNRETDSGILCNIFSPDVKMVGLASLPKKMLG